MKGISIKQPWAGFIALGLKTIETRVWSNDYRGPLLICASMNVDDQAFDESDPAMCHWLGYALAIVELVDIHFMTRLDEEKAMCLRYPRANSFVLDNLYKFDEPMRAKGALYLWDVDDTRVHGWTAEIEKAYRERFNVKTNSK
jgi:hypothetical protein